MVAENDSKITQGLSCPQCSGNDIRRPFGWRVFGIAIVAFVLNGILMLAFEKARSSSYVVETMFDAASVCVFVSLLWTFFSALLGKNRCKTCGFRWKRNA
jgi:hypothetical protein